MRRFQKEDHPLAGRRLGQPGFQVLGGELRLRWTSAWAGI
jgi:hypothetical protein